MLAFRPHTRSELSTKLTDKGYDKACIERSINRLQELVRPSLTQTLTTGCTRSVQRETVIFDAQFIKACCTTRPASSALSVGCRSWYGPA